MIMAKQNLKLKMRQTESAGFFALQFNLLWKNVEKSQKLERDLQNNLQKQGGEYKLIVSIPKERYNYGD